MVLVSRAEKRAIYTYLLKEGVIVVRKDSYLPRHHSIPEVPNLKVMMIVKSLVSQGYLTQVFNWQWSYYTVTSKGVTFLAKSLGKLRKLSHAVRCSSFRFRCVLQRRARHVQAKEGRHHRSPQGC